LSVIVESIIVIINQNKYHFLIIMTSIADKETKVQHIEANHKMSKF